MKKINTISFLFIITAIYDGLLGIIFIFAGNYAYQLCNITPPNHIGYVQFPAALLIIFAIMFTVIAKNPIKNRNLIPYGILLKTSYCAVVFFHWFTTEIPYMWKPFAIFDLLFLILFLWAYVSLGKLSTSFRPEATVLRKTD